ncbi:MAG: iron-containing alcohol dehydrogenase [Lachnospiraceae bacterium]|nr:iron-containing alcohol dehydrogenase [Lachnospiraceae bacterium]
MDNFTFYSPTYFVFGKGTEAETGKMVKKYGGKKVLIHYGGGSVKRSGLLDRVKASLDAENIPYVELGGAQSNPKSGLVYEGIELARKEGVDFLLAVGGGSAIDSAKGIALGTIYDGDFWDFYDGTHPIVEKALPVGVVLTNAATGSEASTDSVVTSEEGNLKRCAEGDILRPVFSIMNPELTETLPVYQTASGITDIMAHCMERYFSKTKEVEITDRLLEAIMITLVKESRRVMQDPNNYEARANIMWCATIAHNNSTGIGRAQDWGTHHLENQLSTFYGCSHGEGLGILFPHWMRYALNIDVMKFAQFANRVWGVQMNFENPEETALTGIEKYEEWIKFLGLRTTITELGGKEEDIPAMVDDMFNGAPNHGNFLKLTREIASEIYRQSL